MATPFQANSLLDPRRSMNVFQVSSDKRAIDNFQSLKLIYWNEWEAACKFQDCQKQNHCMRRICALEQIIAEFKQESLGR